MKFRQEMRGEAREGVIDKSSFFFKGGGGKGLEIIKKKRII
jgi:hypothetical protein